MEIKKTEFVNRRHSANIDIISGFAIRVVQISVIAGSGGECSGIGAAREDRSQIVHGRVETMGVSSCTTSYRLSGWESAVP